MRSVRLPAKEHQVGPGSCPGLHLFPSVALPAQQAVEVVVSLVQGSCGQGVLEGSFALNSLLSLVCHSSD